MSSRSYLVRLVIESVDRASSALKAVSQSVEDASRAVEGASKNFNKLVSGLKSVGEIAGGVIAGLIGFNVLSDISSMIRESVQAFAEFEAKSVKLAALAREAGQDISALAASYRVAASAVSRDFAVSANDAFTALEALVKAGLSGRDAILALAAVVQMARLEAVDFSAAGSSLVQVMAQFGVSGSEAARVVDVLVNASRLGIGAASDFARGLANCGATARMMGLSLEDAATWLVILERRFGSAEEAGTHLNRFLLELYEIAGKLGVPIRDLSGNLRNANEIILDVVEAARALGGDFKSLQDILKGVDARAVKALATFIQMTERFAELREEIGRQGSAWEAYERWLETTQGRFAAMNAEVDRMKRRIGESLSGIATYLGGAFLPAVEAAFASWRGIIASAVGDVAGNLEAAIEVEMLMGRITEEQAGRWIASWAEMGRITVSEALAIAEHLGIMTDEIMALAESAASAGASMPETFRAISSAADQARLRIESLTASAQSLSSFFTLISSSIQPLMGFYDAVLAIEKALGQDVQLTQLAVESKQRLGAISQTLSLLMSGLNLVLQGLQLHQLGAADAGNMLLNTFTSLIGAVEDGIVTKQEFIEILRQLGVDARNVAGSLHGLLIRALEATRHAVEGNIGAVNGLIESLRRLDGMTATYRIIRIIEERSAGGAEKQSLSVPSAQRGAWFTQEGLYYLHRGELILPRNVAEWFRRGGIEAHPQVINVRIEVNAMGIQDSYRLAEAISDVLRRRIRAVMA